MQISLSGGQVSMTASHIYLVSECHIKLKQSFQHREKTWLSCLQTRGHAMDRKIYALFINFRRPRKIAPHQCYSNSTSNICYWI